MFKEFLNKLEEKSKNISEDVSISKNDLHDLIDLLDEEDYDEVYECIMDVLDSLDPLGDCDDPEKDDCFDDRIH
jgi:hypothetical protein